MRKSLLAAVIAIFIPASEAGASLIKIKFSMQWGAPQPLPLFGESMAATLSFLASVDTNNVSSIVRAGSSNGSFIYRHDIFLFAAQAVQLSEVRYGNKVWTEGDLSPIGYGSNGVSLLGVLAIEGGLNLTDFTRAAIRFVDNAGRLDFNTNLSPIGTEVVMGTAGSMNNSQLTAFAFLAGQSLQMQFVAVPEPTTFGLFAIGLAGLGFMGWRRCEALADKR